MPQPDPAERLANRLQAEGMQEVARAAGGVVAEGEAIRVEVFGEPLLVMIPSLEVKRPSADARRAPWFARTVLLHYLAQADGSVPDGEWIALHDLPDGTFYHAAYQGYSGNKLVRAFANDVAAFAQAAEAAGGKRLELGDAGFGFDALPQVPLAALFWAGEEEIPPKCSVLFDVSASHHLPTDLLAVLGGALADRIIKHRPGSAEGRR